MRLTKRGFYGSLYAAGQLVVPTLTGTLASFCGIPIGGCFTLPHGANLDGIEFTLVLEDGESLNLCVASSDGGETVFVTEGTLQKAARKMLTRASETARPSETFCAE